MHELEPIRLLVETVPECLVKNCAWCNPPDNDGNRIGRAPLLLNQKWTDGICAEHVILEQQKIRQLSSKRSNALFDKSSLQ